MTSKVDNIAPIPSPPPSRSLTRAGGDRTSPAVESIPANSLSLTEETARLLAAQRELGSTPTMDQAKIDALRIALAAGTYRLNPNEIASRLIALERELGL